MLAAAGHFNFAGSDSSGQDLSRARLAWPVYEGRAAAIARAKVADFGSKCGWSTRSDARATSRWCGRRRARRGSGLAVAAAPDRRGSIEQLRPLA